MRFRITPNRSDGEPGRLAPETRENVRMRRDGPVERARSGRRCINSNEAHGSLVVPVPAP